jgi:rhomboid protease GluP
MAMAITIGLIIINCIIFLIMEILGDTQSAWFMMEHGGIYPLKIVEEGEYWRFLSAMFLHFGFDHLLNNMVMLGAAGRILEKELGRFKYFLLYIIAGIGGGLLSFFQMMHSGDYAVAAGASGAIFGIVGALCWIVILHKGRFKSLTGRGLLIMIALCLYYGLTTKDVDNWGHIGGLLMGFVMAIILYRRKRQSVDFMEDSLYT